MATCMHNGIGCSPKGTPLYKCAGYFEHSFGCENHVCDNHAHKSRYGVYCEQCDPVPPAFAMPKSPAMHSLVGRAMHASHAAHGTSAHR